MKKTELILGGISILSIILNLLYVPSGEILTVMSLMSLSFIYFYLSFALFNGIFLKDIFKKKSYKNISTKRLVGSIFSGFILSIGMIAILFKIQSWNGANVEMEQGLKLIGILLIISSYKYFRTKSPFYIGILKRVFIIGSVALLFLLLPHSILIDIKYRNHPEFATALKNIISNPDNKEFQQKYQEESKKLHDENE